LEQLRGRLALSRRKPQRTTESLQDGLLAWGDDLYPHKLCPLSAGALVCLARR